MSQAKMRPSEQDGPARQVVSMAVGGQQFGIAIGSVRDILGVQQLARVPLAPPEIAGVLNLRGRIVTAIDLRRRLALAVPDDAASCYLMNVVVEHDGELYSLMIDRIGEVLTLDSRLLEADLTSLPQHWRPLARGIIRLEETLLVELDVERVLALEPAA